jgi:hypothetical protein
MSGDGNKQLNKEAAFVMLSERGCFNRAPTQLQLCSRESPCSY